LVRSSRLFQIRDQSEDVRTRNAKLFCDGAPRTTLSAEPRYTIAVHVDSHRPTKLDATGFGASKSVMNITDQELRAIINSLRGYFWHSTSSSGALSILEDGRIRVNSDSRLPNSFEQSAVSNCVSLDAISLFDFVTHSDRDLIGEVLLLQHKWPYILLRHRPLTVIFGFKLSAIASALKFYPEIKKLDGFGGIIPRIEVCHCGNLLIELATAIAFALPAYPMSRVDRDRFDQYAYGRRKQAMEFRALLRLG
jgi:hypothetical protein